MSVVAVHGPSGQPFLAEDDDFVVNLLDNLELEFKSKYRSGISGDQAYTWDFGDGQQVVDGFEVTHRYASPGEKIVTVTIETDTGPVVKSITVTLPGNGGGELLQIPLSKNGDEDAAA